MPRQQERYCAKLVSDALDGADYSSGRHFPFLRGDPTPKRPNGVMLPVDAYYPEFRLVLEFREKQHYGDRVSLWDERTTVTGQKRKEQRRKYDERRERLLPANGMKLLIVYDYEMTQNHDSDLEIVKQKLQSIGILEK